MPKAAGTPARAGRVYQIKVTLNETAPPIWRRLLVAEDITLLKLHRVLQIAMGWEDCHLHHFIAGKVFYSSPPPYADSFDDSSDESEAKARLCDVLPRVKAKMDYEYDFGDGWMHSIVVEKIDESANERQVPSCIEGAQACPPEDCGGAPGYADLLETLADPDHEQREEVLEWIGGEFDPAHFDIAAVNRALKPRGRRAAVKG